MTNKPTNPEPAPGPDAELLVPYLDGELDPTASRVIEQRLAEEPRLRQQLKEHQQAWDLLDELPRAEVAEEFARTTVEMVAQSAAGEVQTLRRMATRRQATRWLARIGGLLVVMATGYLATQWLLGIPHRQLLRDLPVIEELDAYRSAESIEFLRALREARLFTQEADDAL